MKGGHYVTKCWETEHNKWYLFNDKESRPISEQEIQTVDAYTLIGVFGERKQTTNGRQKEKHYTSASYTFTSQKTHSPQKITKYRRNELEI